MNAIWQDKTIQWSDFSTWVPSLSRWLKPFLKTPRIRGLRTMGHQDLYGDDLKWLEICGQVLAYPIDYIEERLANDLCTAQTAQNRIAIPSFPYF